jgi:hypothetical protein
LRAAEKKPPYSQPTTLAATIRRVNLLYYGDHLDVLRRHVDDESVDLLYLDPLF